MRGRNVSWYRPTNFKTLLALKEQHPNAKIVVGNTEIGSHISFFKIRIAISYKRKSVIYYSCIIGVEVKFKHLVYPVLIQPTQIREMHEIIETQKALKVGASVTLIELEETLRHYVKTKPGNVIESRLL